MSTSIDKIAQKAKVSITTVSMVLNGKSAQYRISAKTQERILALAREMNYAPNPNARNLRLQRTQTIGLVIADLSNYFFTQLAKYLEQICRENHYLLQISASEDNEALEEEIIRNFIAKSVDGLIIASAHRNSDFLADIAKQTPTVFIDRKLRGRHCSWVCSDNYNSAHRLVSQLAARKPREIAYIGGLKSLSSSTERSKAYKDVLREHGIALNRSLVIEKNYSIEAGYQAMNTLTAKLGRLPDALFTASFTLLEGALRAVKEKHGQIPDSLHIGTYDDHPLLDYTRPPIQSVRQDCQTIAQHTFAIFEKLRAGSGKAFHEEVPARVLIRKT